MVHIGERPSSSVSVTKVGQVHFIYELHNKGPLHVSGFYGAHFLQAAYPCLPPPQIKTCGGPKTNFGLNFGGENILKPHFGHVGA